ncbi:MAG: hypothetical protein ABSD80_11195, partial [Caulobacteraceae bacterium]
MHGLSRLRRGPWSSFAAAALVLRALAASAQVEVAPAALSGEAAASARSVIAAPASIAPVAVAASLAAPALRAAALPASVLAAVAALPAAAPAAVAALPAAAPAVPADAATAAPVPAPVAGDVVSAKDPAAGPGRSGPALVELREAAREPVARSEAIAELPADGSGRVQKGSADPFSAQGDRIELDADALELGTEKGVQRDGRHDGDPRIQATRRGKDLLIQAELGGGPERPRSAYFKVPVAAGDAKAVVLASNPSRIDSTRPSERRPSAEADEKVYPWDERILGGNREAEAEVIRSQVSRFYGFHFIARSDAPARWTMVITTDESEKRSRGLGGVLTYEASFAPPRGEDNYVALPLANFKAAFGGLTIDDEPSLGSPQYPAKSLDIRSIAFRVDAPSASKESDTRVVADLRLRDSEVDMGFFYGLDLAQSVKAFEQLADAISRG